MGNVLAVVGTKGGVSKTTVAMGVAIWTAKLKPRERVLLIDGDLHVRSVELKLCPTSEATLADVLSGKRDWRDAVYTCQLASDSALLYPNLAIMPAGGRFFPLHRDVASEFERVRKIFERMIEGLRSEFFLVLIDTPASVSYEHFILTAAADRVLYVCEANDDSIDSTLTTACGLRKLLGIEPAGVVLSKLMRGAGSREWIKKASKIGRVLGTVPFDPVVDEAFRENLPVVAAYPESSASRAIRRIAQKLLRFRITERTRFSDRIDRAVEQVSRQMAKTKSLKT